MARDAIEAICTVELCSVRAVYLTWLVQLSYKSLTIIIKKLLSSSKCFTYKKETTLFGWNSQSQADGRTLSEKCFSPLYALTSPISYSLVCSSQRALMWYVRDCMVLVMSFNLASLLLRSCIVIRNNKG